MLQYSSKIGIHFCRLYTMQTGALPALPLDVGGGPLLKVRCFQNVSLIVTFPKNERKISPHLSHLTLKFSLCQFCIHFFSFLQVFLYVRISYYHQNVSIILTTFYMFRHLFVFISEQFVFWKRKMLSKHFDKETPVSRAVATSRKAVETCLNGGHNLPPGWNSRG